MPIRHNPKDRFILRFKLDQPRESSRLNTEACEYLEWFRFQNLEKIKNKLS